MKYVIAVIAVFSFLFFYEKFEDIKSYNEDITGTNLMATVNYLASPELSGRLAGSTGYFEAAGFAADKFRNAGLLSLTGENYFQKFNIEYNEIKGTPKLSLIKNGEKLKDYSIGEDFICRGFTGSGELTAEVVFAGYGISMPELGYDDYSGIDVRDKIVLVFKYNPRWKMQGGDWKDGYPREKSRIAREHGAVGILFVSLPNDKTPQEPIASVLAGSGEQDVYFPQLHVDLPVAGDLFENSGKTLKELQTGIDSSKAPQSLSLKRGVSLSVKADYEKEHPTVNVVALHEGKHPELKNEYIVIGAHLDHVGRQGTVYFPGANDNASGSAAIIELAETFAKNKISTDRSIIFALFSSEESGLFGAKHFVENPPVPLEQIIAMFNMDCIAHGDSIRIGGGKTAPLMWKLAKENDKLYTRMMMNATWGGGGADAEPFFEKNIPTLYFVSFNSYTHLHKKTDTPSTLNPELFEKLTRVAFLTLCDVTSGEFSKEITVRNSK